MPSQHTHWKDLLFYVGNADLEYTLSYDPEDLSCLPFEAWFLATITQFDHCLEQGGVVPDSGAAVQLSYAAQSLPQVLATHRYLTGALASEC